MPVSTLKSYGANEAERRARYESDRRINVLQQIIQEAKPYVPITTRTERIRQVIRRPKKIQAAGKASISSRVNPRSGRNVIVLSSRRQCLKAKAVRRAVLLSKGRVNRPGGAPGPYKKRSKC